MGAALLLAFGPALGDHGFTGGLSLLNHLGKPNAGLTSREAAVDSLEASALVLVGIACFVIGTIWTIRLQVAQERKLKAASAGVLEFNDRFGAMQDAIAELVASAGDEREAGYFFTRVVEQAATLFGVKGFRVCVYLLEPYFPNDGADESAAQEEVAAGVYLSLRHFSGRGDAPRDEFLPGTPWGDAAIAVAQGKTPVIVPDCDETAHPIDRKENSEWHSFFAIPLQENKKPRGMLSIDARQKMKFDDEHIAIARTVGRFLTLGTARIADAAAITPDEAGRLSQKIDSLHSMTGSDGGTD